LVSLLLTKRAMATTPQIPPSVQEQPGMPGAQSHSASVEEQALVPVEVTPTIEEDDPAEQFTGVSMLPVELDVTIPVRNFRVRNLLALEPGELVETQWHNGDDVPLAAGNVHLAWTEFEVIETELAVRITRLG
jgi:flagellar motor switch/type III secretory pathway protein FliN